MPVAAGYASGTVQGAPDIDELARALDNDVDEIYKFVYENIEFLPTYGSQKGAWGTLVDGMGNSFDMSELMVELLRAAGYTATYMFGELELTEQEAADWFGTIDNNIWAARNLLSEGFIPNETFWTGIEWVLRLSHVWVKVDIGGTNYQFDPAKKAYSLVTGIDLGTAMSYNQTTFMSNATSGATITSDYVQDINRSNIRNDLDTYTSNLLAELKSNHHWKNVDQVLGGKTIVPVSGTVRQTSLSYLKPGTTPTEWTTDIPTTYYATLRVVYDSPNIDETFYSKDIHGLRLTLTFNTSNEAELRLDGTLVATSSAQGVGTWNSVLMEVKHPYAVTWADQSQWNTVWAGHPYLLAHAWGNAGPTMSALQSKKLEEINASSSPTSEETTGQALAIAWYTWDAHNNAAANIINKLNSCRTMLHHQIGVWGHFDTVFENLWGIYWKTAALDNDWDNVNVNDTSFAMNGIAFEASVIEQLTDIAGVSSTTLLDVAVDNGYKIFDGNSSNWTSTVKPALTNYSSQTLTDIENWWINASPSWRVAVPEDGNLVKDSWQGHGYYAISPWQGAIGIIGGGLKGGSGAAAVTLPAMESSVSEVSAYMASIHPFQGDPDKYAENKPTATKTDDPVTVRTGSATYFNTDIVLGNQGYPYSLNFSKSYSSSSRFSKGPLGWGWSHNHSSSLKESSCGLTALGIYNPMLGAEGLVHLFVTNQLFSDLTKPLDKWVVVSIANRWFIDLCWRNTVNVSAQGLELVFFKKPDGTYTLRTGNLDAELTQLVGGNYKFVTSDLVEYTYDSNNLLSTVSFPYGVTVTYSYSSGKLASVSNNLGRTLTLSYTGDLLSSVSDGTGRTVSYQYDTDENLEKITYPDGEEIVFDYDLPGRMTKQFLSESPLSEVFINTFDSLGRVKEQADQNGEIWKFFLAGTRSRLEDPNGVSKVEKYDSFGNLISVINRFGGETSFEYDGLQRKIKQNSLCGNISEWTYDSLNRLVESRESAIVGSGLSDKVKTFTYDSTWTKKISTITNALGDTTTISYHSTYGKIASVVYPLIGSSNPSISLTYNAKGQIDSITDAVGMVRTYSYNSSNGNLESFVIDDGGLDVTGTLVYDTVGDIISYTDHNGNETTFDYDSSRNRIKVDGPSTGGPEAEYVFDEDGNLTKVKAPTGDISNPWNETEFVWNIDGTIEKLKRNGVDFVTLEYDSKKKVQKITDAVGRITTYTRDSYDRISSIQESVSGTIAQFFYTSCGKISEARDANGNASLNSYDGFGRLKKIEYPDSSYEEFAYDALDNLVSLRRRGGGVSTFSYDEIGRPITISRTGLPTISLEYDFQRITEMSTPAVTGDNSTGQFKFEYDSAGRLSKEIYPDLKEVSYTRDVSGRLTRLTYPDGYYVEYFYDTEDRLVDIKLNGSSSSAISFEYDKQGRRERIVYGNGATADLVYDTNSLLESVEHTFNGSAVTYDYSFNAAFEVVSQSVSDSQYMWHPAAAGTDTYSTANNLNQYSTVNGSSYTYDNYGNLTSDGTWTFSYDSEGCLISASKTGTSVSFKYDPYSRLAIRIQGSGRTRYIYDGLRRIAEYDDVADTLTKRYVFGPGLDEAFIEIDSSGTIKYLHHDRVNSVIAVTDATGVVLNANKYSPFGKVGSTIGSTFGFTGQVYDADLELYFYKLRFYSPALGRFLQPDPIGYKGGSNLYAYVENNPLSYSDPFGLLKKDHKDPTPDPVPPPNLEALLLAMEAIYRVASISKPRTSPRVCIVNAGVSYWYLNTQEQTHLLHKAFELFMASEGFKGNCPKDGDDIGKWGELEVQKFLSYLYSSLSHNSKRFYYNTSGATYAIPDFIFSDPDPAFDGKTAFAEVKVKRAKDPYYDMDLPDIDTILKANQRGLYTYAARTRNGEVFTNDRNTIFPTPMPVDFFRITFWNGDVPLPVNHPGG